MTPKGLFKGAFRRAPQGLFKGAFRMAPQGLFEGSGAALRVQVRLVSNQFHLRSTDILAAKQVDEDEEKSEVDHVEMVVDFATTAVMTAEDNLVLVIIFRTFANSHCHSLQNACAGCGDTGLTWRCTAKGCGKRVCVEKKGSQLSCLIGVTSFMSKGDFVCPQCMFSARKPIPVGAHLVLCSPYSHTTLLQYVVNSHALSYLSQRIHNEPLGVLFLVHGPTTSNYISTQILSQLKQDFIASPLNVRIHILSINVRDLPGFEFYRSRPPLRGFSAESQGSTSFAPPTKH